jgi:ribose-phosphate pyrophosphokinase
MVLGDPIVFALNATRAYGENVAAKLGTSLAEHEERDFEDGEHKARSLTNVRGRDVYVIQSLHGGPDESANDKLCRLLFFLGSLRDAAAGRVTAVVPYLSYARKDRKTKSRDPVTTRYVASLFEAVGVDCVVTLEVHNLTAFHNAFRCRTEHLDARKLFAERLTHLLEGEDAVVVSPDVGGVKRAELFRQVFAELTGKQIPTAFMEKYRSAGVVSGEAVVGDVEGRVAVIIDDLISTGGTMLRAAKACRERGATRIFAAATHGLFVGDANTVVKDPAFEKTIITDSVPPFRLEPEVAEDALIVVETAGLVAEAIHRMNQGGSIVDLLE